MGLFTKSTAQMRTKVRKEDVKLLRKELVSSGMAKSHADARAKEMKDILEYAMASLGEYQDAKEHLILADKAVPDLLDCIDKGETQELKLRLAAFAEDLGQVLNDCLIWEGDSDFASTAAYFKRILKEPDGRGQGKTGQDMLMLRSELENVKAILDDVAEWNAPDFLAFSYYMLHGDQTGIQEMENEQRNTFLTDYFNRHYRREFLEEMDHYGMKQRMIELEKEYLG